MINRMMMDTPVSVYNEQRRKVRKMHNPGQNEKQKTAKKI